MAERSELPSWQPPKWLAEPLEVSQDIPPLVPWQYVLAEWDQIDGMFYHISVQAAQVDLLGKASPCPQCNHSPPDLFWLPVSTSERTWFEGHGQVGWVTICRECRRQVSLIPDPACTEAEAESRGLGPQQPWPWEWD